MKTLGQKGFTIIEMTIAVVILGIIVVVISDMYLKGTISSKTEMARSKLQIEEKNALEGITNNVTLSTKIDSDYGSGAYTGGQQTLILDLPAIDSGNNFLYSGSQKVHDYIIYYLSGSDLHKLVYSSDPDSRLHSEDGSDQILLSDVKSLSFTYDAALPNSVTVTTNLIIQDTAQNPPQEVNMSSKAMRRNSD